VQAMGLAAGCCSIDSSDSSIVAARGLKPRTAPQSPGLPVVALRGRFDTGCLVRD